MSDRQKILEALMQEIGEEGCGVLYETSVASTQKYWVNELNFIINNSIFPQGTLYHITENLEGSYEKVHCSVIQGGTGDFNKIDNLGARPGTNVHPGPDIA